MIRVQGPQEDQYYYKSQPDTSYYVEFYLDGNPLICYKCATEPNLKELWQTEMAQLYPNVDALF